MTIEQFNILLRGLKQMTLQKAGLRANLEPGTHAAKIQQTLYRTPPLCILVTTLILLTQTATAGTLTWDGDNGDGLTSTAANWDSDSAPTATDSLIFDVPSDIIYWDSIDPTFADITLATGFDSIVGVSDDADVTVTNHLQIQAGGFLSTSTVTTDQLTITSIGELHLWLDSSSGSHGEINATGSVSLGGTLVIAIQGMTPVAGQRFNLLNWGTLSGTFDDILLPKLDDTLVWDLDDLYVDGSISIINSPGSISIPPLWWLDANDAGSVSKNGSNEVITWVDKSGNNYNAAPTGSNTPIWGSTGVNSTDTLTFSDDSLAYPDLGIHSESTIFIIHRATTLSDNKHLLGMDGFDIGTRHILFNNTRLVDGAGGRLVTINHNANFDVGYSTSETYITMLKQDLSEIIHAINGDLTTQSIDTGINTSLGPGHIGSWQNGDRFWAGDISEIIYYDSKLSDSDHQAVTAYLAAKYGISIQMGPPTILTQPETEYTVNAGSEFSYTPDVAPPHESIELTYTLASGPSWISIDANSGTVSGTPGILAMGLHSVEISVSDGTTSISLNAFDIDVQSPDIWEPGTEDIASTFTTEDLPSALLQDSATTATLINGSGDSEAPVFDALETVSTSAHGYLTALNLTPPTAQDNISSSITAKWVAPQRGYRPGVHQVIWEATDSANNTRFTKQEVKLYPLPRFVTRPLFLPEGVSTSFSIELSGESPEYPLTFELSVSGTATAGSDHSLMSGLYTLNSGTSLSIPIDIHLDSELEGRESITVDVQVESASGYRLGSLRSELITITPLNIAPVIESMTVTQDVNGGFIVESTADQVTLDLSISDHNPFDDHTTVWEIPGTFTTISETNNRLVLDVSAASSDEVYPISATVSDSGAPSISVQQTQLLYLMDNRSSLSSSNDSNNNGTPDANEGMDDTDQDSVPDFLDHHQEDYVLGMALRTPNSYVLESEPELALALGREPLKLHTFGAGISASGYAELVDEFGYFSRSFTDDDTLISLRIRDLLTARDRASIITGTVTAKVAIPLNSPIDSSTTIEAYRDSSGWIEFIETGNNHIYATRGSLALCPEPTRYRYRNSMKTGDLCLMLEVEDGGVYDRDGATNGEVELFIAITTPPSAGLSSHLTPDSSNPQSTQSPHSQDGSNSDSSAGGSPNSSFWLPLITALIGALFRTVTVRKRYPKKA